MHDRAWAFWRRVQYGTGLGTFVFLVLALVYTQYIYTPATCFDQNQNGDERGVDCGGACTRICAFEVAQPVVSWVRSFRITDGQYNAVAYIENSNKIAASPELEYVFSLYDAQGLITTRQGKTILPPDSVYPVFEARIDTGGRVPTQTFIELAQVGLWLPATVGREQFTVIDRKLSESDGTPKLEAIVRNNELTRVDEVEVVATIFDAKGNALTSSRTFIDNLEPRSEANAVFTWPEPIAKTVRSCEVPTDVILAIDLSGSMNNDGGNPPEPLTSVLTSASAFAARMQAQDQVGVVTFATGATLAQALTPETMNVARGVRTLQIDPKEESGSTNPGEAFIKVLEEFNSPRHSVDARKVVVFLTDGLATAPDENPDAFAQQNATIAKDSGINIYTIGLGQQVNMEFVRSLASAPTQAYQAISEGDIEKIYQTITASLCENGVAVIDIVPKSDASFAELEQ